MKTYTDIKQSAQLANLLPKESADMWWTWFSNPLDDVNGGEYEKKPSLHKPVCSPEKAIPCWSLAALIEVIGVECRMEKTPLDQSGEFTYSIVDDYYNIRTYEEGNPVDACYEMILKLNEQKLL